MCGLKWNGQQRRNGEVRHRFVSSGNGAAENVKHYSHQCLSDIAPLQQHPKAVKCDGQTRAAVTALKSRIYRIYIHASHAPGNFN